MIHTSTSSKIPRPMNCFLAFRLEKQQEILSRCPGANHRDISKIIAKWWKSIPDEEKEPYRERARLAKNEHAKRYPNYKYQPQKRQGKKTRKYMRRSCDRFTSRVEENNRIMEQLYDNPRILEEENHKIAIAGQSPFLDYCLVSPTTVASESPSIEVTQDDLYASYHDPLITHCMENQASYTLPTTLNDPVDYLLNIPDESLCSLPPSPHTDYSNQDVYFTNDLPLFNQDVVIDSYDTSCTNLLSAQPMLGNQYISPMTGFWFR